MVSDRHDDLADDVDVHRGSGPGLPDEVDDAVAALPSLISRGDLAAANALVRRFWFELLRSHGDELRVALDAIPAAALRDHPLLTMMLGICYNGVPHKRARALRYFATAVRAARSGRPALDAVDRALILVSESAVYRLVGRPARGVKPAHSAIRILDGMSSAELEAVSSLPRVYSQAGVSLYYGGDLNGALAAFESGLAESMDKRSSDGFGNLAMLAGIRALRGELHEARVYIELAHSPEWSDDQRSMYTGTFYRIAEAISALEEFDPVAARAHLSAMVNDPRTIEHWITIATTEALAALLSGRPGEGLSRLDAVAGSRSEGRSAAARGRLSATRALLQLALGARDAAGVILHRDASPGPDRHIAQARVELVAGRSGSALRELGKIAGDDLPPRAVAEAMTIEAAALLRLPSSVRSTGVVEHLGSLLEHTGLRMPLALVPPADFGRLRAALVEQGFGGVFEGRDIRSVLAETTPATILSEREQVVLAALLRHSSPTGIAAELVVSVNTVKTQLRSIYRKLGVSSRDEAIAVALDRHLLADRDG
ncbi:LuxR C-terminal-related transcriptional regulator [Leifsonia shinshuensis]|uniref:LuxR family maltose regulon positive regulatory protein n=1 Tax=Leifsonia shinshuensis TaxID=150026 RepID=A0A853CVN2_9MICO|nr:LuxR C-terminal-related transcriptional regulator [Leifsonia shinshuensis]NYJ22625.1 LuxR family maltose regulon positive regulatory protein [Leifsonia shinshuensis]